MEILRDTQNASGIRDPSWIKHGWCNTASDRRIDCIRWATARLEYTDVELHGFLVSCIYAIL